MMLTGCSLITAISPDESGSSTSSTSVTAVKAINPTEIELTDLYTGEDYTSFAITYVYGDRFSITEEYRYDTKDVFLSSRTTVEIGYDVSPADAAALSAKFGIDDIDETDWASCKLSSNKTYLIKDAAGMKLTKLYKQAKKQATKVGSHTDEEQGPVTEPWVLSVTEDTLSLEKYTMRVARGETRQIAVAECPEGFEDKLMFKSDNTAFATVDVNGNVTGVKSGVATITVSVEGASGYSSCMVYVY